MIASSSITFIQIKFARLCQSTFSLLLCVAGRNRETVLSDAYSCQIPCSYVFIVPRVWHRFWLIDVDVNFWVEPKSYSISVFLLVVAAVSDAGIQGCPKNKYRQLEVIVVAQNVVNAIYRDTGLEMLLVRRRTSRRCSDNSRMGNVAVKVTYCHE
jgi:hypothetical protein